METLIDFRQMEGISEEDKAALARSIDRYLELREQIREIESEQKKLRDVILSDMARLGIEKARYEAYSLQARVIERRSVDKQKLIELGVSPLIIRRAETVTVSVSLDIRELRGR